MAVYRTLIGFSVTVLLTYWLALACMPCMGQVKNNETHLVQNGPKII